MCGSRGGVQGVRQPPPPPLKNRKNIWFLSKTGPDPLKNHKATKPAFNAGPTSARKRNAIKNILKIPPLKKLSGSAHAQEVLMSLGE